MAPPPVPITIISLLLSNGLIIWGIINGRLNIGEVLILYWVETVIIGIINVAKMFLAQGPPPKATDGSGRVVSRLFMTLFFMVHYGLFNLVHGAFIFVLAGHYLGRNEIGSLAVAAATLFLSHLLSFVYNYLARGEYKTASIERLFLQPYARVVITHFTILIGFALVSKYQNDTLLPILLVCLKTTVDGFQHLMERRKFSKKFAGNSEMTLTNLGNEQHLTV